MLFLSAFECGRNCALYVATLHSDVQDLIKGLEISNQRESRDSVINNFTSSLILTRTFLNINDKHGLCTRQYVEVKGYDNHHDSIHH